MPQNGDTRTLADGTMQRYQDPMGWINVNDDGSLQNDNTGPPMGGDNQYPGGQPPLQQDPPVGTPTDPYDPTVTGWNPYQVGTSPELTQLGGALPAYQTPMPQVDPYQFDPGPQLPNQPGDLPTYNQAMPQVDPYNVGQSQNWMEGPTSTGGQSAVNPQAGQFGYDEVSGFMDRAFDNSMRHLQPQMQFEDERFAQDLINKGIDPNSEAGQKAFMQKERSQNDQLSKAAYDAMGFGQGIQQQMFGQDATRSQLANALLQSQMGLTQRGREFDVNAGMGAMDQAFGQTVALEGLNNRDYLQQIQNMMYGDQLGLSMWDRAQGQNQFNTQMGLAANNQAYQQMMGLEGVNNRDYLQQIANMQYGDQLAMAQDAMRQGQYQFDTTTGLASDAQRYNQMMGLEGLNYRDYLTYTDQGRYQDSLALALAGMGPSPSYGTVNTGLTQGPLYEYGAQMDDWLS